MIAIIDIETTGLDPHSNQILEFACILWDPASGRTAKFERVIYHSLLLGHPVALAMNARLLAILGQSGIEDQAAAGTGGVCLPDTLQSQFLAWLASEDPSIAEKVSKGNTVSLTACGKNVASFDIPFLKCVFDSKRLKFRHRSLDVGSLCYRPDLHGDQLPDLQNCLNTLGIEKTVSHTALDDCEAVLKILRSLYPGS